jgi:hypothetical protein
MSQKHQYCRDTDEKRRWSERIGASSFLVVFPIFVIELVLIAEVALKRGIVVPARKRRSMESFARNMRMKRLVGDWHMHKARAIPVESGNLRNRVEQNDQSRTGPAAADDSLGFFCSGQR